MGRVSRGGTSGASGASVARVARRTGAPAVRAHTPPCACTMRVRTRCACTRHTWHAGVHPLHIAVKREYTECIEFLMGRELPLDKVKEELGWACQFDLSQSVYCLLENGVPHGLRRSGPYILTTAILTTALPAAAVLTTDTLTTAILTIALPTTAFLTVQAHRTGFACSARGAVARAGSRTQRTTRCR